LPVPKERKIFLNILKYWTTANEEIKIPAINNKLNNFFQLFSSVKRVRKTTKITKNNIFKTPPALLGEPKILNTKSCENIVAKIKISKKPKSKKNGKYARLFFCGIDIIPSFL
jgi:hypothetical protein